VPLGAKRIAEANRVSGPLWTAALILDRALPLGVLGLWPALAVAPDVLTDQLRAIFGAWGIPEDTAAATAEHVLYADLHGIDSHGCAMLLHYQRTLADGSLNPGASVEVVRDSGATALIDGGGGLGHVPAATAMRLAIERCRESGVAAVSVRNSGHFGAAGAYASMAAEAGLIGVVTTNTREPAVVPTFGAEAKLGTNPIAVAAPAARNRPFLLDMATSTASLGQAVAAWRRGRSIPAGWAIDRRGRPVVNGRAAAEGRRLTPLGGTHAMGSHKGYGLATAVEILSGVLPGGGGVGHFVMALDPARFRATGEFEEEMDGLLDSLRSTDPLDPSRSVMVAGDPERSVAEERRRSGIPLARAVVEDLRGVAHSAGVPFTLDGSR
jgi:LDH2 family malate/lactate/ureidoglycolate dehydrogenase